MTKATPQATLVQLALIPNRKAKTAKEATVKNLSAFPRQAIKSITYDNGSENYRHNEVNTELGIKSFFCNPYHSWEKGAVENTNSLIRRWVPKKMYLSLITQEQTLFTSVNINTYYFGCDLWC